MKQLIKRAEIFLLAVLMFLSTTVLGSIIQNKTNYRL